MLSSLGSRAGAAVAALAAVAITVVVTPSAAAHPGCNGYRVGLFTQPNYTGAWVCLNTSAPDLSRMGGVESGWVHDMVPWCLYAGRNYTRPHVQLDPGHYVRFPLDRAMSIKRGPCAA